jgi:UDP-glucose 6-dehydrogenase
MAGFEPGFGGRCWPKDLSALIADARRQDYEPWFLQAIEDSNEIFREDV